MATGATSWNTCNVYGTWHNQDGTNKEGSYTVTIPSRVCNTTDDVIIPAGVFATGTLNVALGQKSFSLDLPANDDPDNSPVDWGKVKIEIKFSNATPETYVIDTPVDGSVNLRTVLLPATVPTQAPFLVLGVPGGAAQLSADGTKVLGSDGTPITGGGSSITDATATTLAAGTSATAAVTGTTLELGIPRGATGATGAKGDTGATGAAGTAGHSPTVGMSGDQVTVDGVATGPHLTGPQGVKGDTGATGATGTTGATGAKGDPGTTDYNALTNKPTIPSTAAAVGALPATLGATATSNVVVVAHGATAPTGLPNGTVIVEMSA